MMNQKGKDSNVVKLPAYLQQNSLVQLALDDNFIDRLEDGQVLS